MTETYVLQIPAIRRQVAKILPSSVTMTMLALLTLVILPPDAETLESHVPAALASPQLATR